VSDPSGVSWETFFTFGDAAVYGEDSVPEPSASAACCAPEPKVAAVSNACC
jgi:hypothetical protein